MQLDSHIQAIQEDLAATAGLGDEATARAAQRLSEALASTLHLRLLDLLGEAALEIGGQLGAGRVEVRLAGREPELVVVMEDSSGLRARGFRGGAQRPHLAAAPRVAEEQHRGGSSIRKASRPTRGSSAQSRACSTRAHTIDAAETASRATPRVERRVMFLAPIPFDYATLLDSGDRVRKAKKRSTGTRLRRTPTSAATQG